MGNFPFTMTDVISILNLCIRHRNSRSIDADCPFCAKRGKLNIHLQKEVFHCNYCDERGGMLDLYAKIYSMNRQEAYRAICYSLRLNGYGPGLKTVFPKPRDIILNSEAPLLEPPLKIWHKTFSCLFSLLKLSSTHKQKLLGRGLSEKEIIKYGYKSTPAYGYPQLAAAIQEQGCVVEGVPGFYKGDNGQWTVNFHPKCSGIIIPIYNLNGLICGAQIRLDIPIEGRKYIWFSSSSKNEGTGSGSPIGFCGDVHTDTVYLTEGYLKATVAHCLSNKAFLGQAGVNNYKMLEPTLRILKKRGVKTIIEAHDMEKKMSLLCYADYSDECKVCESGKKFYGQYECPRKVVKRQNIQKGCMRVKNICSKLSLDYRSLTWDLSESGEWNGALKGIDDFLFAEKLNHVKE